MIANPIPFDLSEFILATIDSVVEIEALLLLHSGPEHAWSHQLFARRLYISEAETSAVLRSLCEKGLAEAVAGKLMHYRYSPRPAARGLLVDRLVEMYARDMIAVTNIIHSKPPS
jgi:hypothetical protein